MTRSVSDGPPYLAGQAASIVEVVDGRPTIPVGHSGAGPLLAAMGQSLGYVEGHVFLDAGLPHPGRSWFDSAPPELAEQLRDMASGDGCPRGRSGGAPQASMSSFPTPTSGSASPLDALHCPAVRTRGSLHNALAVHYCALGRAGTG